MDKVLTKIQDLSTMYLFLMILGVALFNILIDCESLRKKKLKKEEKISRYIGYGWLSIGAVVFVVTRFVL